MWEHGLAGAFKCQEETLAIVWRCSISHCQSLCFGVLKGWKHELNWQDNLGISPPQFKYFKVFLQNIKIQGDGIVSWKISCVWDSEFLEALMSNSIKSTVLSVKVCINSPLPSPFPGITSRKDLFGALLPFLLLENKPSHFMGSDTNHCITLLDSISWSFGQNTHKWYSPYVSET